MTTETLAKTKIGKLAIRLLASAMESQFKYRFLNPVYFR